MSSKNIMGALSVALLFCQMGFADISSEFDAEDVQSNQEVVVTEEEMNSSALAKNEASQAALDEAFELEDVQN